jgi:LuxR family maltose regulon positive regulatory protein
VAGNPQYLLVPTKLTPPQTRAGWVRRERLLTLLGARGEAQLTLVVAPAGFGKSTLVAQWLGGQMGAGRGPAWLTLDEHDQEVGRFLAYLAGAVSRAAPAALVTSAPLLAAPEPPPPYIVLQALLVDLSALAEGLTLVLDDYHMVRAEAVHQAVGYLLRHLPPSCRMVLLSRSDPPLPLARLRAEGQLAEVRAAELRFTLEETGALLAGLLGGRPEAARVSALHEQTEGWAIALQLAALVGAEGGGQSDGRATRQIAEYLADEVFDRQPEALQQALLALAVPERFCAGLCAALLGTPGELARAEGLLEQLVRANLFVLALDEQGHWYRFHHLFRDLLLRRLRLTGGQAGLGELQRRAADWLAEAGLGEEAVRLYLSAGDEEAAGALVERQLLPEMGKDVAGGPPGYWLRLLPAGLIGRRPGLALIVARLTVFSMDMTDFQASLERVDALLANADASSSVPLWPTFQADLLALRGILCYWQGRPADTISYMRAALALGPTRALTVQSLLQLGLAYVGSGAYAEGIRLVEAGQPEVAGALGDQGSLFKHSCLAAMHQLAGELASQADEARRLTETVVARAGGDLWVGYAASSLGLVAYERSDLAAAAVHFGVLANRKYRVSYPGYMSGVIGLALVAAARGAFAEADTLVAEALSFAEEAGGAFLRHQALGCAVRVALARGDVPAALSSAEMIGPDMHLGLSLALETPRLSRARALLAAGDGASLAQAESLVAACLAEVEPLHNMRLLIACLAVEALLRQAQGRRAEALASLERAVGLAAPRGFVRTFVDLGPGLEPLLHALAASGVATSYLKGVLGAHGPRPASADRPLAPALRPQLPELLTPREFEILGLLAERWSDKEIAERLVIAPNTVRKHTSTIYDKLGVRTRREAVGAAQALGLLPD